MENRNVAQNSLADAFSKHLCETDMRMLELDAVLSAAGETNDEGPHVALLSAARVLIRDWQVGMPGAEAQIITARNLPAALKVA